MSSDAQVALMENIGTWSFSTAEATRAEFNLLAFFSSLGMPPDLAQRAFVDATCRAQDAAILSLQQDIVEGQLLYLRCEDDEDESTQESYIEMCSAALEQLQRRTRQATRDERVSCFFGCLVCLQTRGGGKDDRRGGAPMAEVASPCGQDVRARDQQAPRCPPVPARTLHGAGRAALQPSIKSPSISIGAPQEDRGAAGRDEDGQEVPAA